MGEGPAQAGLVVAELAFGDGQVLPGGGGLGLVAAGQAVEGVEDGTRAVRRATAGRAA